MAIELNVVGVFYTGLINVRVEPQTTVKNVLDEAKQQSASTNVVFDYIPITVGGVPIVDAINVFHKVPFESRSKKPYPLGVYGITQNFTHGTPNPYTVWQYYLFNAAGGRIPVPGEQSFTVTKVGSPDPAKQVAKIVWRLVSVCNKPTGISHRLQGTVPQDLLTTDIF